MINVGSAIRTDGLLAEADVKVAQGRADVAELTGRGVDATYLGRVEAKRAEVADLYRDRERAQVDVAAAMEGVAALFEDGKDFLEETRLVAVMARDDGVQTSDLDAALATGRIKQSRTLLIAALERIVPTVEQMAAALAAYGIDPARGRGVLDALRAKHAEREVKADAVPPKTADFYAAKGELYFSLKRIQRAGRLAFRHDPERAAAYEWAHLKRRRRAAAPAAEEGPAA